MQVNSFFPVNRLIALSIVIPHAIRVRSPFGAPTNLRRLSVVAGSSFASVGYQNRAEPVPVQQRANKTCYRFAEGKGHTLESWMLEPCFGSIQSSVF